MSNDNHVSATITDEIKIQILAKFQEVMDLLPFLVNAGCFWIVTGEKG